MALLIIIIIIHQGAAAVICFPRVAKNGKYKQTVEEIPTLTSRGMKRATQGYICNKPEKYI